MLERPSFSIAICTYNRAADLEICLTSIKNVSRHLSAEDEIIVVDNNSTDDTPAIVDKYTQELPIKYVFEECQGLSAARNRALQSFSNNTIIFIDDDISITVDFIESYRHALATYPEVAFFGGQIKVDWQGGRPRWLHDENMPLISGLIVNYNRDREDPRYGFESLLPYGANFAMRRELIEQVGEFDESLGVKGVQIGRGEETDYMQRALRADFSGRYISQALVFHRTQVERLHTRYIYRYGIQKGLAGLRDNPSASKKQAHVALIYGLKGLYQLLRGRRDRYYQCVINVGIAMASWRT